MLREEEGEEQKGTGKEKGGFGKKETPTNREKETCVENQEREGSANFRLLSCQ